MPFSLPPFFQGRTLTNGNTSWTPPQNLWYVGYPSGTTAKVTFIVRTETDCQAGKDTAVRVVSDESTWTADCNADKGFANQQASAARNALCQKNCEFLQCLTFI